MPWRVTVGGKEHQGTVAEDVVLTVYFFVIKLVIEVLGVKAHLLAQLRVPCRSHLVFLHKDRRTGKEFVAAAMVKVEVRVNHVADVVGSQLEIRQLSDDLFARLGTRDKQLGNLAKPADWIVNRLTVDAGIKHNVSLGVGNQVTGHRHGEQLALLQIREEQLTVELEKPAG